MCWGVCCGVGVGVGNCKEGICTFVGDFVGDGVCIGDFCGVCVGVGVGEGEGKGVCLWEGLGLVRGEPPELPVATFICMLSSEGDLLAKYLQTKRNYFLNFETPKGI